MLPSQRTEYRSHMPPPRARLCLRRQRPGQTVHLATSRGPDCASGDSARARLCIWRHPARQTVSPATSCASNCVSDDNERQFFAPGCRRRHSLWAGLSPEAQFKGRAVAVCVGMWPNPHSRRGAESPPRVESADPDAKFLESADPAAKFLESADPAAICPKTRF